MLLHEMQGMFYLMKLYLMELCQDRNIDNREAHDYEKFAKK